MKRIEPSELQATDYKLLPTDGDRFEHRYAADRGLIAAFCGLLWLLLLVGSVGYVGGWVAQTLNKSGGESNVR